VLRRRSGLTKRVCPPGQVRGEHLEPLTERSEELDVERDAGGTDGSHDVGQDVNRVPQRRHLELDGDEANLLDRSGAAHVAIADERHGLAVELGERVVERVLEQRGIAVVVLGGEQDVAVGLLDLARPGRDFGRVVAVAIGGRLGLVVERERVVAQVDELDVQPWCCSRLSTSAVRGAPCLASEAIIAAAPSPPRPSSGPLALGPVWVTSIEVEISRPGLAWCGRLAFDDGAVRARGGRHGCL
jgi:hypothetical protein